MFDYKSIRTVHLELSSYCNARCPLCPRTDYGITHDNFVERNLTLSDCQKIFPADFLTRLRWVLLEGNFGDPMMNPELIEIVEWFLSVNPRLPISITTNGGTRNQEFWKKLATLPVKVQFSIDGLEDTNHLYRQDVSWQHLMDNAGTFIAAGGYATWKFIKFDHNRHQIDAADSLAKQMGFKDFNLQDHGRNLGPVFDRKKQYTHSIGDWQGSRDFEELKNDYLWPILQPQMGDEIHKEHNSEIQCRAMRPFNGIYIDSLARVYPCCWTGFATSEYGIKKKDFAFQQIFDLVKNNNALEHPLWECIQWFSGVSDSWKKSTLAQGRLQTCHQTCGGG